MEDLEDFSFREENRLDLLFNSDAEALKNQVEFGYR